jgi:DnaK suppressor protein
MINIKTIEEIKEKLLSEKNNLLSKVQDFTEIDSEGDETDEIQSKIIANLNKHLSDRNYNKLQQIENALKKIEENKYGNCEECEEEISDKRLIINP